MKHFILLCLTLGFCSAISAETLRVVTEDLPPYQIALDGKAVGGSSVLLVREMLKRAEINVPIEVLPWARAYKIATTLPDVVIFSMARNKEREAHFHWLLKLRDLTYHFYSLAARPDLHVDNIATLLSRTVVAVRHSYEANSLLNNGFIEGKNLMLTSNYKEAWQMLLKGRADYTYANELVQDSIFQPLNIAPNLFSQRFDMGETSDLYIATSAQIAPALLQHLQRTVAAMENDGTVQKIVNQFNH